MSMIEISLFFGLALTRIIITKAVLQVEDLLASNDYCPEIGPDHLTGIATQSEVSIYVEGLFGVSETTMDFSLDIYFKEYWQDTRLIHNESNYIKSNKVENLARIWRPDIYVANAKSQEFRTVTMSNVLLRIYPDGTIYLSRRLTMTVSCMMQLHRYPMDMQDCGIKLISYSNTVEYLNISWLDSNAFLLNKDIELPQFVISRSRTEYCNGSYSSGKYSCLEGIVTLKRHSGAHLFQTFLPTVCIVAVSWISFWINPEAVPARVTLSITTLLAISTQSIGVRQVSLAVSYATAIDIWMGMCVGFLVATLVEFAFVNVLMTRKITKSKSATTISSSLNSLNKQPQLSTSSAEVSTISSSSGASHKSNEAIMSKYSDQKSVNSALSAPIYKDKHVEKFKDTAIGIMRANSENFKTWKRKKLGSAQALDTVCRYVFPLAFAIFNVVYWLVFGFRN